MPDTAGRASSSPRFEIISERDVPKKRRAGPRFGLLGSLTGAVRAAIEDVYVTFAGGVMRRGEGLEDALAGRRHAGRVRRDDRRLAPRHAADAPRIAAPRR